MKVKFFFELLLILCCSGCAKAQRGEFVPHSEKFKTFLEKFPDQNMPIHLAEEAPVDILGTDKMTQYEGSMWERHLTDSEINQFVKGQIPFDMESVCFLGCMAGARVISELLPNDNYVLLLIDKDPETPCGEEEYLVVYNREGKVVDYLVVYGNYSDLDVRSLRTTSLYTPYSYYSKIEDDGITILKKERFLRSENGEYKHYRTIYTIRKYELSNEGKFVKTEEKVLEKKK